MAPQFGGARATALREQIDVKELEMPHQVFKTLVGFIAGIAAAAMSLTLVQLITYGQNCLHFADGTCKTQAFSSSFVAHFIVILFVLGLPASFAIFLTEFFAARKFAYYFTGPVLVACLWSVVAANFGIVTISGSALVALISGLIYWAVAGRTAGKLAEINDAE